MDAFKALLVVGALVLLTNVDLPSLSLGRGGGGDRYGDTIEDYTPSGTPRRKRRRHKRQGPLEGVFSEVRTDVAPRRRRKRTEEGFVEGVFREISPLSLPTPSVPMLTNPTPEMTEALTKRKGRDRKALERAFALSQAFHGTPTEVVELEPHERILGKYAVVAGSLEDFSYRPGDGSKRGGTIFTHRSGDRGSGQPEATEEPLVVVDPDTRRPAVVPNRSPMRFSAKRGFVG